MEQWRKKFISEYSINNIIGSDRESLEGLLDRFKQKNPKLMLLNPEVGICHITTDAQGNKCNLYIILVGHRFIFDYRLIPDQFESFEVSSKLCEQMPSIFPEVNADTQIEVYHATEKYEHYVKENLNKIRKTLKSANLTNREALDALTAGIAKHKEWIGQIIRERMTKHRAHIEFFEKLLSQTDKVYRQSEIYSKYKENDWGYSISSTSFHKNEKVIVGLNWGVDSSLSDRGKSHGVQKEYPLKDFSNLGVDLGSFSRTIGYFHRYFDVLPKVQTNYCFFRSENESQIRNDLSLCNKLFESLMEYLQPSMIISFSKALNNFFDKANMLKVEKDGILEIASGNKVFTVVKGFVNLSGREIKYINLPHPNYPILGTSRDKAWEFCFGKIEINAL